MKGLGLAGHGAPEIRVRTPRGGFCEQAEQGGIGTGRGEVNADARGLLDHPGADLDEFLPEGDELALIVQCKMDRPLTKGSLRMHTLLVLMATIVVTIGAMSQATAQCRKAKVTTCNLGPNVNCSNVDLRGERLSGKNLEGARITCANLEGANLKAAKLIRANLVNTNLRLADLTQAKLNEANLTGSNLAGATLYKSILVKATLRRTNLRDAILEWASLVAADLRGADLSGANLQYVQLENANLAGANLRNANLYRAHGANHLSLRKPNVEDI